MPLVSGRRVRIPDNDLKGADLAKATRWTDEKVKALKLPAGVDEKRTLVAPGLYMYLRRKAAGALARQWQYRVQVDGKRRWLSLGSYPEVGLADAEKARIGHEGVRQKARLGEAEHPAVEAQQARAAVKANPTVEEAFAEWIADKRLGSKKLGGKPVREKTIEILQGAFDLDIRPVIGGNKIGRLAPPACRQCINRALGRGSPGAASHTYRTLRGLVRFAISREFITGADPMRGIDNPRPYKPSLPNAANDAELVQFLKVIDSSSFDTSTRGVIDLELLTGLRPSECRDLEWSRVDLPRKVLFLDEPDVKTGNPFAVHLSAATIKLLEAAKLISGGGRLVFPGRVKDKPLSEGAVSYALRRKWKQDGVSPGRRMRPHDLRKTFRTMLSRLGVSGDVAGLCLNHSEEHVLRRIYDGHDFWGEMVEAWDRVGVHIERLRNGGATVVQLVRPHRDARA